MAAKKHYACSSCGQTWARDMLTVKKVIFTTMGSGSSTTRARVVGWLCPLCRKVDEDWNREPNLQPEERPPLRKEEVLG